MSEIPFSTISDLEPKNKHHWKIKVRVTTKWSQTDAITGRRNGLNLILVDEEVTLYFL